jgi:hypothetical protein
MIDCFILYMIIITQILKYESIQKKTNDKSGDIPK